jgi:tRNA pseudouridine55 synthase
MMQIDGLLIVDKPEGITSLGVVKEVKRQLGVRKAGHIGTLDPFATGVLPIAINEGTKLIPFLSEEPKDYEAILKLGEETATDDLTGEIMSEAPWKGITPEKIHDVFQTFLGKIQQLPPMFSAVKVNGKPLYRLARKGIEIERKWREVQIFNIQIDGMNLPQVSFSVSCSKGTYIRTIARDIGRKVGCGAHLLRLRRVRSGPFAIEKAMPWDRINELSKAENLRSWLIPLKDALPSLPELRSDDRLAKKVRFGRNMVVGDLSSHLFQGFQKGQWLKMSTPEEGLIAILRSEIRWEEIEGIPPERIAFRPLRVFQPNK